MGWTKNDTISRGMFLLSALSLCFAGACGTQDKQPGFFKDRQVSMGTIVEITLVCESEAVARELFEASFMEMDRLDNLLGVHEQRGAVWELNNGAFPEGVAPPEEVYQLLKMARGIGRETAGAFDCTMGALMRLWSFETGGVVPTPENMAHARASAGWDNYILDDNQRKVTFLKPGLLLDLGGIGKGYAVDRVFQLLAGRGVKAGIVNAGGDMVIWGKKPDGDGLWRIGIQHPRDTKELLGTLTFTDKAVVTSGDYEKTFTADGKVYHHILDPSDGYPTRGVMSVTVVADSTAAADAYATAFMVMGLEKSRSFLLSHQGLEAIIVDASGEIFISRGLKDVFRHQD